MNPRIPSFVKRSAVQLLTGLYLGTASTVALSVTNLDIANVPLYLEGIVEPNISLTLDNSGSMAWAYMPDQLHHDFDTITVNGRTRGRARPRALSPSRNAMAYNPMIEYLPPASANGGLLPQANFNSAWDDGYSAYLGTTTCKVNLSTGYRAEWAGRWASLINGGGPCDGDVDTVNITGVDGIVRTSYEWLYPPETPVNSNSALGRSAYYYLFYRNHFDPAVQAVRPVGCDADESEQADDNDCYVRVVVNGTSGPAFRSDERQNFANWYSYYRNRMYTARAGLGIAFAAQGPSLRVGYGRLNGASGSVDGVSNDTVQRGVRKFEDRSGVHTNRGDFFDWLYEQVPSFGGTPLRRAAGDVGEYYERKDSEGPWSSTPGSSGGSDFACRQSYHILTSDGYWNSSEAGDSEARKDTEAKNGTVYTNHALPNTTWGYKASDPYKDGFDHTLADVAMYYWKTDLRTDVENKVPASTDPLDPKGDPAFWQHLSMFTVGLGVMGTIDKDEAFEAIRTSSQINWPQPASNSVNNVDDMLHAAVNARGDFFSASDPATFSTALKNVLKTISDRKSSSSSVSLSSFSLFNGGRIYQATFNTGNWSGDLLAFDVEKALVALASGSVPPTEWRASEQMPTPGNRRIFTAGATGGVAFQWNSLGASEKNQLDPTAVTNGTDSDLLRYVRGEKISGFRERDRDLSSPTIAPLADIINSTPAFIGQPRFPYPDDWGSGAPETSGQKYSDFRILHEQRPGAVATGANDGMLHIFDEKTGVELYAYIPSVMLNGLADLASLKYSHRYYVDGTPTVVDAFFGGYWHTMLVGGLNAGGQAVYGLDVTSVPGTAVGEATVASKLQWEFTDADDADLGYTFSRPNIVRMANGEWAAVFGNGYNNTEADGNASSTGNAVLYIVRLSDGALIKKIDTQAGTADDPLGLNRPNGLSTVTPIDENGDFIVDYIYGGDLFGNLWRFDVNDTDKTKWKVGLGMGSPAPLFKARASVGDDSTAQAIFTRPQVVRHPGGEGGVFILFGTGKYFEVDDITVNNATTQTFYAIWDRFEAPANQSLFTRNHLLKQEILRELTLAGGEFRETSDHAMKWFLSGGLPNNPATNGYLGWYMDLINTQNNNTDNYGERVVFDALVFGRSVLFTTLIPSDDPCEFGGSGWLMEMSIESGSRPPYPAFDTNGDGVLGFDSDTTTGTAGGNFLSGTKSDTGIPNGVSIGRFGTGVHKKFYSDSEGNLNAEEGFDDVQRYYRQSWRRLQ